VQWRSRLAETIHSDVQTREQNLQNSRFIAQALDEGALKDLIRRQVREALGPGESCGEHPECSKYGFDSSDWYYTVGRGDEEKIGKRPFILVGFGPHSEVIRTFNLRIH
jgi:hypothetical protein